MSELVFIWIHLVLSVTILGSIPFAIFYSYLKYRQTKSSTYLTLAKIFAVMIIPLYLLLPCMWVGLLNPFQASILLAIIGAVALLLFFRAYKLQKAFSKRFSFALFTFCLVTLFLIMVMELLGYSGIGNYAFLIIAAMCYLAYRETKSDIALAPAKASLLFFVAFWLIPLLWQVGLIGFSQGVTLITTIAAIGLLYLLISYRGWRKAKNR